jgi:hypothetical protein
MKSEFNKHKNNLPAAQLGIVLKNFAAGIFMIGVILPITQVEALAQDILWTRQFGTANSEGAKGITTDSSGIYVAGSTDGTLPGQVSAGYDDAYVRKYDVDGDELWTRQFGSSSTYSSAFDYAHAITADSSGIYIAGDAGGTLPGQTSAGGVDAFVRKYDAGGNELWTRQFGSSSIYLDDTDHAYAITAVSSGIYIAGSAGGTLPGQTGAESRDAFVRKYDADGVELWTRQFGNAYRDVKGFPYTDSCVCNYR